MIRPEFRVELENQQRVLVFVWAAFLVTVPCFLWIAQLLIPESQPAYALSGTMRQVLWVFTLMEVGVLLWWRKVVLSKESLFHQPRGASYLPNIIRGHQSSSEERAGKAISSYVLGRVIGFAIAESVVIYGLVLSYVGRYFWDQYLLSFISLLMLVYFYPSKSVLDSLIAGLRD